MPTVSTVRARHVSPLGRWSLDAPSRLALVQITLAVAMAVGLLISRKLWLSTRDFPLAPVAEWLPVVSSPWEHIWWAALLILLAAMALWHSSRWPVWLFILAMLPLAALDQMRWQPWVYQYLVMMAVLALRRKAAPERSENDSAPLNACRLIIVATYVWSGLQKCNASFHNDLGPWLLQPLRESFAANSIAWATDRPLLLAATEITIGLALLLPRVRPVAAVLAIGMHLLILFVLGPLGHNCNRIVWPWNAAMIALVPILFLGSRDNPWSVLWPGRSVSHWLAAVLLGLLPALNFCDRWDSYLSLALYSGNTLDAHIELRHNLYDALPPTAQKHCIYTNGVIYPLNLSFWSLDELNVPPNPSHRVYLAIARQLGTRGEQLDDCVLVFEERPHFTSTERAITRVNCGR